MSSQAQPLPRRTPVSFDELLGWLAQDGLLEAAQAQDLFDLQEQQRAKLVRAEFVQAIGEHWSGLRIPEHLHHFTPKALRSLIESAGFRIVTWRTDTVLAITQETINTWGHARGGAWRRLVARLPSPAHAPASFVADRCGRGQMLRVVAVSD